jgi:hypothetical protein
VALGENVPLPAPSKKTRYSNAIPQFEGQASVLIWCAWRLDGADGPLTSWDDAEQSIKAGLAKLVGSRIDTLDIAPPAWDMDITFSNSLCLRIFCDHVPGEPSFDGNWDIRTTTTSVAAGPGANIKINNRAPVED